MKLFTTLFFVCLLSYFMFGQSPDLMTYQAVVRDNSGLVVAGSAVGIRIAILQGSPTGAEVFAETHTVITNDDGIFSLLIGDGSAISGSIGAVNWSEGTFYLFIQIDPAGGTDYSIVNTSQLVSVPYAFHSTRAQQSETAVYADSSSVTQYAQSANESQFSGNGFSHVSPTGDTLYLLNGNHVIIPGISAVNSVENGSSGCTDNTACNYDEGALEEDGSCQFVGSPCDDGNGNTISDVLNTSCECEGMVVINASSHSCGALHVHNPGLNYGDMTDQQGNTYKTIVIGTQEWMAENLNTSIYLNGDSIITNLSNLDWENAFNTEEGAWAYYNDDATNECPYGKLYNWFAVNDARGLCPQGWHVPTDSEWATLINYLDPSSDGGSNFLDTSGRAMKTVGTIETGDGYWYSYNNQSVVGTNSSGFSGLPGGHRHGFGGYDLLGRNGYFWSSTPMDASYSYYRLLYNWLSMVYRHEYLKHYGFAVRCLRD